jgi:hypothetical protein
VKSVALASLAVLACAFPARADERRACVDAADSGQTLRDQGKLVEARESFVTCARDACPAIVSKQCTTWLNDIDREIATVTFRATDSSGKELVDVQVSIDGALRLQSIDGRAMRINPGVHWISFSHSGDADVEQEVVVHAGEKARLVEVRIGARSSATAPLAAPLRDGEAPPTSGFRFPLFAAVSLGVGAVSFVTMGVLVGTTASDVNHLRATCAGSCSPSDVDSANTRIVVANIMMGLGITAVATAGVSLFVVNFGHSEGTARQAWVLRGGPGSVALAGTF